MQRISLAMTFICPLGNYKAIVFKVLVLITSRSPSSGSSPHAPPSILINVLLFTCSNRWACTERVRSRDVPFRPQSGANLVVSERLIVADCGLVMGDDVVRWFVCSVCYLWRNYAQTETSQEITTVLKSSVTSAHGNMDNFISPHNGSK